jgi:two-component system response regulator AauR
VLLGCQQALALEDIACEGVGSAEEALKRIGDELRRHRHQRYPPAGHRWPGAAHPPQGPDRSLPVVLITGHGDISMAVGAMRNGAYDFMEKPFSPSAWSTWPAARWNNAAWRAKSGRCAANWPSATLEGRIIGRSPAMQNLRELIANVADTSANVLIEGETGTGKELVARCLHDFSRRQATRSSR